MSLFWEERIFHNDPCIIFWNTKLSSRLLFKTFKCWIIIFKTLGNCKNFCNVFCKGMYDMYLFFRTKEVVRFLFGNQTCNLIYIQLGRIRNQHVSKYLNLYSMFTESNGFFNKANLLFTIFFKSVKQLKLSNIRLLLTSRISTMPDNKKFEIFWTTSCITNLFTCKLSYKLVMNWYVLHYTKFL